MSMTNMYDVMKRRERENVKKRGRKRRVGNEREREFGTFSLLFLNVNILFRTM